MCVYLSVCVCVCVVGHYNNYCLVVSSTILSVSSE